MRTIDAYVLRSFAGSYLLLLAVLIGLYVFADVVVNLDEFTDDPQATAWSVLGKIADYHGYKLPLYFHQLGGVVLALAASFTFAMMLKNNELTPLVAAGVPLQRLAVPVLTGSVVVVGLWLANSEFVVPALASKIVRRYEDLGDTRHKQDLCVRDDHNAILSARELHVRQGWLRGVHIIEPDPNGVPAQLITADEAFYDPSRQTWKLTRGARLTTAGAWTAGELGDPLSREPVDDYPFTLTPEQILLRQSSHSAELMSIRQMNAVLASRNLPNLAAIARSRDVRFTQPLMMWILIVLAIPFFLTREPANVFVAGGKALLAGGFCFGFTFLSHSASTESPAAVLATALPVLIFGPLAVLHLANVKT